MIYNSAGHHLKDSGAVATHNGKTYKENEVAILLRNSISRRLSSKGVYHIVDKDTETLAQYLNRIKPGSGSVLCEAHMNSFSKSTATGIEVIIPDAYDKYDMQAASIVALGLHKITGLPLRNNNTGVITESASKRGKLGFLRKPGINILIEYGFISNPNDLKAILDNIDKIGDFVGDSLILFDTWLT